MRETTPDRSTLAARLRRLEQYLSCLDANQRVTVRQAADALDAMAWQPIEHAPRIADAPVLLYWPAVTPEFCFEGVWSVGAERWKAAGVPVDMWLTTQPTHFMPLPPIPATAPPEGGR